MPNSNNSDQSVWNRFVLFMTKHGLTATKVAYRAYQAYCAEYPQSTICGSRASMQQWLSQSSSSSINPANTTLKKTSSLMGGGSSALAAAPASFASQLRAKHSMRCEGDKLIITATDLLTQVASPGVVSSGTNFLTWTFSLAASELQGTRVKTLSGLWEKYRLRRLRFHYSPILATSSNGSIVLAWDNDPADPPASSDLSGLRSLYSYRSNVTTSVWAPVTLSCALDPSVLSYFTSTSADVRTYSVGKLQVANSGGCADGTTFGNIWIEYEIEFSSPSELSDGSSFNSVSTVQSNLTYAGNSILNYSQVTTSGSLARHYQTASGAWAIMLPPGQWYVSAVVMVNTTTQRTLEFNWETIEGQPLGDYSIVDPAVMNTLTPSGTTGCAYRASFVSVVNGPIAAYPTLDGNATIVGMKYVIQPYEGEGGSGPSTTQVLRSPDL